MPFSESIGSLRPPCGPAARRGALSGILLGLASLPLLPLGWLAFVALVPLLTGIERGVSPRAAAGSGVVAGLFYFGIAFGFVLFASVAGGPALPAAYAIGVLILATLVAFFAWALAHLRRLGPGAALLAAPGLWVATEFLRSQGSLACPWFHLGNAVADHPHLIQMADLVGVYGVSLWVVAVNAGLVLAGTRPMRGAAMLLLLAALPAARAFALDPLPERGDSSLRVAAIQPAIPNAHRHVPGRFHPNLRRLLSLSNDVLDTNPHLVVWPESAWERSLPPAGDAFLNAVAHGFGTPLLTGAWRVPQAGAAFMRNSAVLARPDGGMVLASEKLHPVIVYERAPSSWMSRALARLGWWGGRFEAGDPTPPVHVERLDGDPVLVGVLVCVDSIYPKAAHRLRAEGAQILVEVSNEAGSGSWSALLHARSARLRAVETRTPLVRVANTGPTQWIDSRGRVVASLEAGSPGAATHSLHPSEGPPLIVRIGDEAIVAAALASSAVAVLTTGARRRRPRQVLSVPGFRGGKEKLPC